MKDRVSMTLRAERRVSGCQKLQMTIRNPVWHMMQYSCTHMATVDDRDGRNPLGELVGN